MKKKDDRAYAKCKVCRKIWNISAMAKVEEGKYVCPNCKFKASNGRMLR